MIFLTVGQSGIPPPAGVVCGDGGGLHPQERAHVGDPVFQFVATFSTIRFRFLSQSVNFIPQFIVRESVIAGFNW